MTQVDEKGHEGNTAVHYDNALGGVVVMAGHPECIPGFSIYRYICKHAMVSKYCSSSHSFFMLEETWSKEQQDRRSSC